MIYFTFNKYLGIWSKFRSKSSYSQFFLSRLQTSVWTTSISQGLVLCIDLISQGPLIVVHRLAEFIELSRPDLSTFTRGNRKQLSRTRVSLSHWAGTLRGLSVPRWMGGLEHTVFTLRGPSGLNVRRAILDIRQEKRHLLVPSCAF